MMKKYQFIIFLQGSDFDDIEKELRESLNIDCFSYCFQWYEEKEKAIELLSRWDYGEYYTEPVNEKEFLNEIGSAAEIYYSNLTDYVLITYGFDSAIGLYRVIKD